MAPSFNNVLQGGSCSVLKMISQGSRSLLVSTHQALISELVVHTSDLSLCHATIRLIVPCAFGVSSDTKHDGRCRIDSSGPARTKRNSRNTVQ